MRLAIFGGGSIGSRHAANARALGHEVKVFDKREDRGCDPLNSYAWNQFASAPIDAVMICTPAADHEHSARLLRSYGYVGPLFCEKPIALRSAAPVFQNWPHPTTMVGYNLRFHPAVDRHLRNVAPTSGRLTLHCDSRAWPGAGYADLLAECSHEIDLALSLGAPAEVGDVDWESAHEVHFRLGEWAIHLNDRSDLYWRCWEVRGGATCGTSHTFTEPAALGDEMYVAELRHFLEAAAEGRPTGVPFSQGLRVIEVCERVRAVREAW